MKLTRYTEKLRNLAEYYFREEKALSTTQRCCVSLKKNELSIVCIDHHADMNNVLLLEKFKYDEIKSLPLIMGGVVKQYQLTQTPVYWLLEPDDYQLNLIESMPVPKNEFKTALKWRIHSLINYPIDETVMESFELPAKKNSPQSPLIAAVTAQKVKLANTLNIFKDCRFNLVSINIPELVMLNLSALHESDEKSTAFLYFFEREIIFNISNRKTLYFTRRINIPFSHTSVIDYEALSLEILRYFDFFRSQWRLASPTRIIVATDNENVQDAAKVLTERLMNPVEMYVLGSTILDEKRRAEISGSYLLNYGCLLKQSNNHV